MPSKSQAQAYMMRWAAHDADFAKRHNIDQKTAREFVEADRRQNIKKLPKRKHPKKIQ